MANFIQAGLFFAPAIIVIVFITRKTGIRPLLGILAACTIGSLILGILVGTSFHQLESNAPAYAQGEGFALAGGLGSALALLVGSVGIVVRRIFTGSW